jgi:hypothetical protein
MKTLQKILFCAALLLAVSCSDAPDKMLTIIYADGSCQRELSANADSAFMTGSINGKNNPFPVEIDSNYSIVWQYKVGEIRADFPITQSLYDSLTLQDTISQNFTKKKKDFLVFASRNYKSVEEMSEKFKLKPSHSWSSMDVKYSFEKKFRFFYSYFTFTESYPQIKTPFETPIENYMSKEEADFWFTGEPNLTQSMNGLETHEYTGELEKNYEKWFSKNMWNLEYDVLVEHYDMLKNPPVSKDELLCLRDTVFELSYQNGDVTGEMPIHLDKYFKTNVFSEFWEIENSPMGKSDEDFENHDFMSFFEKSFDYQLIMPGKIIYTNGTNRNDTLNWNLTAYRMFRGDYVIEAQSRKINAWMLVLTGMLALTAIVIFVYKRRKIKV